MPTPQKRVSAYMVASQEAQKPPEEVEQPRPHLPLPGPADLKTPQKKGETAEEKRRRKRSQTTIYLDQGIKSQVNALHHDLAMRLANTIGALSKEDMERLELKDEDVKDLEKFETLEAIFSVGLDHLDEVEWQIWHRRHLMTR